MEPACVRMARQNVNGPSVLDLNVSRLYETRTLAASDVCVEGTDLERMDVKDSETNGLFFDISYWTPKYSINLMVVK